MSTFLTVELITIAALLAALLLLLLALGPLLPLLVWVLLTVAAFLEWRTRRRHAALYHRHGRDGAH
ncbi:MAG: hypothetical protein ACRDP6_32805, partial [Actinoallomurus sp.]